MVQSRARSFAVSNVSEYLVRPDRFELPTYWFEASCSIQLSYRRTAIIVSLLVQA